ncbi:MAG TPA: hypothetical protein VKA48_07575, partial [Gammaproteobacteria bacterium]|nr:hypothetical protein [Gammaproteobacteria bacterium]
MYKRKARILFLDPGSGSLARMAAAWAQHLGGVWIEAGVAALAGKGGVSPFPFRDHDFPGPAPEVTAWEDAEPGHWDLVVPMGVPGGPDWDGLLAGVRHKRWDL